MNPYENLPEKAFWKRAVASKSMFDVDEIWDPKFKISSADKVVTFGSCFAQHIGRALDKRGFGWLVTETAPHGLSGQHAKDYNYGVFSARTGNIYTTSLLKQWTQWALEDMKVPDEVWEKNGRFYDPFRPRIEPGGFMSKEELIASRQQAISAFRDSIVKADFFVFTLGLTESWMNSEHGYEYPMCPGTVAGDFDAENHVFENQLFNKVLSNLREAIQMMRQANGKLKFILTVSPVPLTATNSGSNVIVATMESKSVLRAVAGQVARKSRHVDYFPSYEIINSPVFKGMFFEPNQRSVNPRGVNFVMDHFFSCQEAKFGVAPKTKSSNIAESVKIDHGVNSNDAVCEEELLNSFG